MVISFLYLELPRARASTRHFSRVPMEDGDDDDDADDDDDDDDDNDDDYDDEIDENSSAPVSW